MPGKPRGVSVRGRAELVEGTQVRFFCPEGHVQVEDLGRKGLPISQRLSPAGVALLARWWGRPNHYVTFICRTCTKNSLAGEC
jgi:hypothetical protein